MMYSMLILTMVIFYIVCGWMYLFIVNLLGKLEQIDDNLSTIRVDLAITKNEVQRAQKLIERRQDAV